MSRSRPHGQPPESTQFEAAVSSLRESFERLAERHARLLTEAGRPAEELEKQVERLQRRVADLERENRQLTARPAQAGPAHDRGAESDLLAHLYVAGFHLHRTLSMDALLGSIQEILINLVGTESHAIYLLDADGGSLLQVADDGPQQAPAAVRPIPLGEGILGVVAKTGIPYFDADRQEGDFHNPVACVPMKADGRVLGVIQVMRLLSHKRSLTSQDHEIFTLLAETAGTALVSSLLRRRFLDGGSGRSQAWRDLLSPVLQASDSAPAPQDAPHPGRAS